jgi:CHASE2 domain-containing sensor protein
VCKVPADLDGEPDGIHPPDEVPQERQSFSDFVADEDEISRRQLLQLIPPLKSPCAQKSFQPSACTSLFARRGIKPTLIHRDTYRLATLSLTIKRTL